METSEYLEQVIGEKEGIDMNKKRINYTEAPKDVSSVILKGNIITDFLPPPEKLVRKEPKVKITITLNSGSVDFFKKHAKRNNVKYQTMINEVLDKYVKRYKNKVII
jgi:predicted DNA binding CopG/RHH family protein